MADIEMIIKIPDHLYKLLKDFPSDSNETTIENVLIKAVENGTPIPDNTTNDEIIEKIKNIDADNLSGNYVKALCIDFLISEKR